MNTKLYTIIIIIGILSSLFGCKNKKRYKDKQGNVIIEKVDETYIIPADYKKSGKTFKIYFRNETNKAVNVKEKFNLKPNEDIIVNFVDTDSIIFEKGPKIFFGETGLETQDEKGELAGIGGEYWKKYNVPDDVEYGFVIVKPGEGD